MSPVDTQPQPIFTSTTRKHAIHDLTNKKSNSSLKDLHNKHLPKRERLIPETDTILDLEIHDLFERNYRKLGYGAELRKALIPLVNDMLPGWEIISHENDIQIERVSGALTNCVFYVTNKKRNSRVVLRIYGNGVDQLCNRKKELDFLEMLSTVDIGPKLLGIFKNGRFEEYLDSAPLKNSDLRDPSVSRHIGQRMAQLHNIAKIFPPPQENIEPEVWLNTDKWYQLALNTEYTSEQKKVLEEFDLKLLGDEIFDLKNKLSIGSPIVFAHNDTQCGNILRLTDESNQLVVVDFEYAGYNFQAFDLANHFCEWMYNYNSPESYQMDTDKYPNDSQQINFLQSYIEHLNLPSSSTRDGYLKKLKSDVDTFKLASHVMWGLWGLVQSGQSHINFDYFSYAMQRLRYFRALKNNKI